MNDDPREERRCNSFGNWYGDKVFVLVSKKPDRLRAFFESMGLKFNKEKHGRGPIHWAAQVGESVLEIYPSKKYKGR